MNNLDMEISDDSVTRLIDLFADHLYLEAMGFTKTKAKKEGCPYPGSRDTTRRVKRLKVFCVEFLLAAYLKS